MREFYERSNMSDYYLCNQLISHLLNAVDPISKADLANFLGVSAKVVKRLKESINERKNAIIVFKPE